MSSSDKFVFNQCVNSFDSAKESSVLCATTEIEKYLKLYMKQKTVPSSETFEGMLFRNEASSPTIKISSVDGFFNRKRGRPPKNRYVQVYKNLQLPPQAVFTSFKLERTIPLHGYDYRQNSSSYSTISSHAPLASTLSDCATENFNRSMEVEQCKKKPNNLCAKVEKSERRSVVRSSGIFYPENFCKNNSNKLHSNVSLAPGMHETKSCLFFPLKNVTIEKECNEFPEDLSIRSKFRNKQVVNTPSESKISSYLNKLHLINWYRNQSDQEVRGSADVCQKVKDDSTIMSYSSADVQQYRHLIHVTKNETAKADVVANSDVKIEAMSDSDKYKIPLSINFTKHRFDENCGVRFCGCKQRQTHFHCEREDCQYSFCDRTRFLQHSAPHRRLDILLGNNFKQYQPHILCGYPNCSPNITGMRKSASHFHCIKCQFSCWETNKFASHRRWHNKLEFLKKTGFRKVLSSENCSFGIKSCLRNCPYILKQTHYHCILCNCSMLSKAQMIVHKHTPTVQNST